MIYPNQKKARNNLLKQKAKLVGVRAGTFGKDDTFVTGGGVPGRQREAAVADSEDDDPNFDNLEDQLLGQANQYERDFNKMMGRLNDIDNMMSGNDLKYIKEMMDYSQQSLMGHTIGYAKLREKVHEMGDDVFNEIEISSTQMSKADKDV